MNSNGIIDKYWSCVNNVIDLCIKEIKQPPAAFEVACLNEEYKKENCAKEYTTLEVPEEK